MVLTYDFDDEEPEDKFEEDLKENLSDAAEIAKEELVEEDEYDLPENENEEDEE